jgi:hypothetical protein
MIRDLLTAMSRSRPDRRRQRRFVPEPPGPCRLEARLDLVRVALAAPVAIGDGPGSLPVSPVAPPAPDPTAPMPLPPADPPGPFVPD